MVNPFMPRANMGTPVRLAEVSGHSPTGTGNNPFAYYARLSARGSMIVKNPRGPL